MKLKPRILPRYNPMPRHPTPTRMIEFIHALFAKYTTEYTHMGLNTTNGACDHIYRVQIRHKFHREFAFDNGLLHSTDMNVIQEQVRLLEIFLGSI